MQHMIAIFVVLVSAPLAVARAAEAPKPVDKPNVLFIISDDQGYSDFGFTRNKVVHTPNLDRLASESAVFRNFVVAAACSPSRAAFYTGREHLSTGVWGVPPRANLRRDEILMPAFFKPAGYHTLHVGKADCTRILELQPWDRGWDDAFLIDGGYRHRDPSISHKHGSGVVKGWTADIMTDRALEWIRSQGNSPWFASVAYIIPHLPWVCDEKYSLPFRKQGLSPPLAACYGSIEQLDDAVGRLLAGLRKMGQAERTIVVFVSDNGMTNKDSDGKELSPEDWKVRDLHGLRGHKAMIWENGIRVPLLVRWPGHIQPGDRSQFGCAEDILPTMLDLAGIKADPQPPHLPFDGVSLRASLNDPAVADPHPGVFRMAISFEGSPRPKSGIVPDARALKYEDFHLSLRGAQFKFHALPNGASALYDVLADPTETTDVKDQYPEVTARMSKACRQRWDAVIASERAFRMPTIIVSHAGSKGHGKANVIVGSAVQDLKGSVRVAEQSAQGFVAEGDSASYTLEVHDPGSYQVMLRGRGLDVCAPLRITLGNLTLNPVKSTPTAISFGVASLPPGAITLQLIAAVAKPTAKPAAIKDIALSPVQTSPAKEQ